MYTLTLQGKDIIVTHPQWQTEPQVIAGWTWHAELVRQLIAERDALRADAGFIPVVSAPVPVPKIGDVR
jgi:hypothetical protein